MNQYKFRGISTITNTWVYGSLLQREDSFGLISLIEVQHKFPHEPEQVHVIAETVGLWTGFVDAIGREVYKDDVTDDKRIIQWSKGSFWMKQINSKGKFPLPFFSQEKLDTEIIGNIHDHPHLLNPAQGAVTHTMKDPNLNDAASQPATPPTATQEATNDQVQATEQEAQEKALESEETEG